MHLYDLFLIIFTNPFLALYRALSKQFQQTHDHEKLKSLENTLLQSHSEVLHILVLTSNCKVLKEYKRLIFVTL